MKARLWLLVWLLGLLFPLAWLGRFSAAYQRLFDRIFAPAWVHVVMHAALYAGLVLLLWASFKPPPGRKTVLLALGLVVVVGVFQEGLQAFSQGYVWIPGVLFDLGVDLVGGAAGLGASYALFKVGKTKTRG